MNYYGATELAEGFRTVRKNTVQMAEDIPEDQYGFAPAVGARTVAQTLVHIALSPRLQLAIHSGDERRSTFEGFDFPAVMKQFAEEEAIDRTKAQVLELLRDEGETWARFLEGASEDLLAEPFTMPPGATPPRKSRFEMLLSAKEHEMHHRGQLAAAQRMLGIVPHLTRAREEQATRTKPAATAS